MKNQGDVSHDRREGNSVKTAKSYFTATDLAAEYTFFNHGILFGPAGLRDPEEDPLIEWYNRLGDSSEHVLRQVVEHQIFRGLDAPAIEGRGLSWNNIFCGVRNHLWQDLLTFICSMTLVNRAADNVYLVTATTITVNDPILVDRYSILHGDTNLVPITVFCLDGSRDRYALGVSSQYGVAEMQKLLPQAETVALWEQIKAGDMKGLAERTTADMDAFMRQHAEMRDMIIRQGPQRDYRRCDDED